MKWKGIQDSGTDVGDDGPKDATGISFFVDGEVRRRPGLTQLSALGGVALGGFRSPLNGAWLLIVTSTGTVESAAL